jgi:arabinogalactan oligomer / maltooligosaccharide transport system permease protein
VKSRTIILIATVPVALLVLALTVIPIVYNIYLSTTNMSLFHYHDWSFIGLDNYLTIFTSPVSDFGRVLLWNFVYSLSAILIPFLIGIAASLMLKDLPRPLFFAARPILMIPWAVPAFITILIFKGLFNYHFGAINNLLDHAGFGAFPWLDEPSAARLTVLLVSIWLAFPFMTLAASGALESLPKGIFEAARLDGAGPIGSFFHVTFPLVARRMIPVLVLGFSAAFNNFTVIYLLTGGGPTYPESIGGAGATDIVISAVFKMTLTSRRWGLAAAYAVVIFIFIGALTLANMKALKTGRKEAF